MLLNINLDELDNLVEPNSKLGKLAVKDRFSIYSTCLEHILTFSIDTNRTISTSQPFILGGEPNYSGKWPVDKSGMPMRFVLEFGNFSWYEKLSERSFQLYLSPNYGQFNAKAQSWFHINSDLSAQILDKPSNYEPIKQTEAQIQPFIDTGKLEEVISQTDKVEDALSELSCDLLSLFVKMNHQLGVNIDKNYSLKAKQARQMAAFFANGISYSEARAKDEHYSHLVKESKRWFVLFKLRENSICEVSDKKDILFCIRYDDFTNSHFERGRPIIL